MASTHKKVIVRKMDRDYINGYIAATQFISGSKLEMLNTAGNVVSIDLNDVKCVYFVREFDDSESLMRKTFITRPRVEGLWVRLRFRDNEVLEGVMPNNLTHIGPDGYFVNPVDTRSNTQRIFVPRTALTELVVLSVIGSRSRKRKQEQDERQPALPIFSDDIA